MNTIVVDYDTYADICWLSSSESNLILFEDFIFNKFCYEIKKGSSIIKTITIELFEGAKSGKAKEIYSNNKIIAVDWDFKQGIFKAEDIGLDFENIEMMNLIEKEMLECPDGLKYQIYADGIFEQYHYSACCLVESVIRLCNHIMLAKREKIYKESHKCFGNYTNTTTSKPAVNNRVFLLDEVIEYVKTNKIGKHSLTKSINCPCWSVRGHYRHYKNGKVVFVKSYEKGKEKGKTKPLDKAYVLQKRGDLNVRI